MIPSPGFFPDIPECGPAERVCFAPYKNITGQLTPSSDDAVRHTDACTELFQISHFSAADPAHPVPVRVDAPVKREATFCTEKLMFVRVGLLVELSDNRAGCHVLPHPC